MDFITTDAFVLLAAGSGYLGMIGNALSVILGLGAVIFFHELGHFAVAKWCDVHVERFSIGIGPIIWSRQKGETEYALSALPFGGYVKMLGQDDNPNNMAEENRRSVAEGNEDDESPAAHLVVCCIDLACEFGVFAGGAAKTFGICHSGRLEAGQ